MITLFWCGVCAILILVFTKDFMEDYVGRVVEIYCSEKLAMNQSPTVMVHFTDVVAAEFERPWWEGGPAPR